ncbi:unnamed protein product [Arabidopsis thaliana]|uniref:Transmembrane protein n=1 Tax=Arabidopsis thaliana TaxID=3702 RepID=A0A654FSI7_ARATH|nr:unnamed protein product [Arabidopsis thaliana]
MSGSSAFHIILSVTFMVFLFGGLCEAGVAVNVDILVQMFNWDYTANRRTKISDHNL